MTVLQRQIVQTTRDAETSVRAREFVQLAIEIAARKRNKMGATPLHPHLSQRVAAILKNPIDVYNLTPSQAFLSTRRRPTRIDQHRHMGRRPRQLSNLGERVSAVDQELLSLRQTDCRRHAGVADARARRGGDDRRKRRDSGTVSPEADLAIDRQRYDTQRAKGGSDPDGDTRIGAIRGHNGARFVCAGAGRRIGCRSRRDVLSGAPIRSDIVLLVGGDGGSNPTRFADCASQHHNGDAFASVADRSREVGFRTRDRYRKCNVGKSIQSGLNVRFGPTSPPKNI
jgi:hypothetical protein